MEDLYRNDIEFLDYSNLDIHEKEELLTILKSRIDRNLLRLPWCKKDCAYPPQAEPIPVENTPKLWQQYEPCSPLEVEGPILKYETQANASSVLVTVPSSLPYGPPMMQSIYPEWSFNISNDPNVHQTFIQQIPYAPQNVYQTENQELTIRDTGRRGRGRGSKNYNRSMSHTNEVHAAYIGDHAQYQMAALPYSPQMYCLPDPSQQHPGAVQPIYYSQVSYHSPSIPQPTHRMDYSPYHQSPSNMKYTRQAQILLSQSNGETVKSTNHKPHNEKRMQNVNIMKPSNHRVEEDEKNASTNIVTRVIMNNSKIESTLNEKAVENPTANNSAFNSNKKYDFKIEHIVSKISNENYKGTEKNEVPCVNIKSSIEVTQNGNEEKEPDGSTSQPAESLPNIPNISKIEKEETQEIEVIDPIPTEVESEEPVILKAPSPTPILTPTPTNTTWANILKKNSSDSQNTGLVKPTAFITPQTVNAINGEPNESVTDKIQIKNTRPIVTTTDNIHHKKSVPGESKKPNTNVSKKHCDDPITYRMGEYLLSYKMEKQTVSLTPRGLTNRSNYCYINSILQALLACPPFYNLLMAMPFSRNPSKNSPSPLLDNMIKFVREFSPLSDGARLPRKDRAQKKIGDTLVDIQSGAPFEPSYVYSILKNTASPGTFSEEGRQEDAEEFLTCLLNGLSDEMLELMKLASNNDQQSVINQDTNSSNSQGEDEWRVMGPKKGSITRCTDFGRTPLSDIFRGQLRSRVSRALEESTDYVQPFFTLQLDIKKAESVKTALEILVGKDPVEGMTCSKTNQEIEAWKQLTLEELPVILILHLKWFDYNGDVCSKIVKTVDFPVDLKIDGKLLSIHAKSKLNVKQKQYKLFAVTYHDGKEATKGHYVTDAFHVGFGGWVRYDDSSLKGVSEENVLKPLPPRVPYLLYYRRCDTIGNNQSNNIRSR